MSTYEEELEGREFDWYAVDSEGHVAIFTTAGEGHIPKAVLESFILHDEISESMESPNWGSSDVWSDFANQGFFVFDWELPGGPYKRQCSPASEIDASLKSKILRIAATISIRFSDVQEIVRVE